jgi:hypothetical protein
MRKFDFLFYQCGVADVFSAVAVLDVSVVCAAAVSPDVADVLAANGNPGVLLFLLSLLLLTSLLLLAFLLALRLPSGTNASFVSPSSSHHGSGWPIWS